MINIGYTRVFW